MSQVVDETNAEGEGFNFNQWLIQNDLVSFKPLFAKHGATTTATLQITSPEMRALMADPLFYSKPQLVPNMMTAIHQLSVPVVTVVLSEKEQAVIDTINQNMKRVHGMRRQVDVLKSKYPKSQQRVRNMKREQMDLVAVKITETFDVLCTALNQRKQDLLDQLQKRRVKEGVDGDAKHNDDDDEELEELTNCTEKIDNLELFLKSKAKEYNALISTNSVQSNKTQRVERQKKILQIGQDVYSEFVMKQSAIGKGTESVRKLIRQNDDMEFTMSVGFTDNTFDGSLCDRIIGTIRTLGRFRTTRYKYPVNFQWIDEAPPSKKRKNYCFGITNGGRTISKTKDNGSMRTCRLGPWLNRKDYPEGKVKVYIRVDAIGGAIDMSHGVEVITKERWEQLGAPGVFFRGNAAEYCQWRFTGSVYRRYWKVGKMRKIDTVQQVLGVEIDFGQHTVKYELYHNDDMQHCIASYVVQFDGCALTRDVCIALSVRAIGWKFTVK